MDAVISEPDAAPAQDLALCETEAVVVEFTNELLADLRRDPSGLVNLSPEQFELFLCGRFEAMGMEPKRVGSIYEPDGGIDILAWPRRQAPFPFLIGVQARHHSNWSDKVGVSQVREFGAVIQNWRLQAGLFVTNTSFTATALWENENRKHIIRLREFEDLRRWILDNFLDDAEWREIPEQIEYAPGKFIRVRPC